MQKLLSALLGAVAGAAFTTMGLIETGDGFELNVGYGNDATGTIIVVGVVVGALLGATLLARWPAAIAGLTIGLLIGIWIRDNSGTGDVQPPGVFLLLFGLPLIGAWGGYLFHKARSRFPHQTS